MGNKVDISEVIEFSTDFSTASRDLKSQLKEVEKNIETLHSMDNFTGKAANGAKMYFNDLHTTLLKSFEHLLTELDERMKSHLNSFQWDVDSSESVIIDSGYLLNTETEINDDYELFAEEQETIRETLANVSDISSANQPSTFSFDSTYDKTIKIITELEENLESYTNKKIENVSELDELLHHIETTITDSGAVTEDHRFTYFMGSTTPDSLLTLQGYNQKRHRKIVDEATESRDSAITNMDESLEEIATKALNDLDNGIIDEDEYYAYLDELRKLNNEENADGDVSEDFIQYVVDNIDGASKDFKSNSLAGIIEKQFKDNANEKLRRADLIKDMNAGKPGAGAIVREQGKKALKIRNAVGGTLTALTVGYGTYDDYMNTDKTLGEATSKNSADALITGTTSMVAVRYVTSVLIGAGTASPVGWGIIAGITTATVVTTAFNYIYDNNYFGLQTGLDWAGQKLDEIGEAVSGFFDAINIFG